MTISAAQNTTSQELFAAKCREQNLQCVICINPYQNPHCITKCLHVFCKTCIEKLQKPECPSCKQVFKREKHLKHDFDKDERVEAIRKQFGIVVQKEEQTEEPSPKADAVVESFTDLKLSDATKDDSTAKSVQKPFAKEAEFIAIKQPSNQVTLQSSQIPPSHQTSEESDEAIARRLQKQFDKEAAFTPVKQPPMPVKTQATHIPPSAISGSHLTFNGPIFFMNGQPTDVNKHVFYTTPEVTTPPPPTLPSVTAPQASANFKREYVLALCERLNLPNGSSNCTIRCATSNQITLGSQSSNIQIYCATSTRITLSEGCSNIMIYGGTSSVIAVGKNCSHITIQMGTSNQATIADGCTNIHITRGVSCQYKLLGNNHHNITVDGGRIA